MPRASTRSSPGRRMPCPRHVASSRRGSCAKGVTNVVRHSGAHRCAVRLGEYVVEVADDGVGPAASKVSSTGLGGLRERVEAAGGRMSIGRSDLGGFSLTVTL